MQRVIVTGAAGFIGGQTMLALRDAGKWVMGIDRRPLPDHLRDVADSFLLHDFSDRNALAAINSHHADAVIHCAGTSLVGPSMTDPSKYYDNNFVKTKILVDHLLTHNLPTRLIFSSSAAVYGEPVFTPCNESDPTMPVSPYGESKRMTEMMLEAYHRAYGLNYVAFRYFNACGADSRGRHGQEPGASHIIAQILESLQHHRDFYINGNDYNTADGTCIRDYLHVEDLASAHAMATDKNFKSGIYNLSGHQPASNIDVVNHVQRILQRSITVKINPRRPGDPAVLTASSARWQQESSWKAKWTLDDMIIHAWNWYRQHAISSPV